MSVAIITGSAGLVGSEAAGYFASLGMQVVGIDNGMRAEFFGPEASTDWAMPTRFHPSSHTTAGTSRWSSTRPRSHLTTGLQAIRPWTSR